jgi:hypothetical protein
MNVIGEIYEAQLVDATLAEPVRAQGARLEGSELFAKFGVGRNPMIAALAANRSRSARKHIDLNAGAKEVIRFPNAHPDASSSFGFRPVSHYRGAYDEHAKHFLFQFLVQAYLCQQADKKSRRSQNHKNSEADFESALR